MKPSGYPFIPTEWPADFHEYHRILARRFAVAAAWLTLVIVPLFQVTDLWAHPATMQYWWQHLGWRLLPLASAAAILLLRWRMPEGNWPPRLLTLHGLLLMAMMTGLFVQHFANQTGALELMVKGLIIVTAAVAVITTSGARELAFVYGLPLSGVVFAVLRSPVHLLDAFFLLLHPLIMMVIGLVLADVLYRVRVDAFRARKELAHSASTDVLTGLSNRRALERSAETEHARSLRHGTPYTLVMADIDHFKSVNDSHGHDVGDEVLRELAQRLKDSVRTEDEVGRWGGEEFMILLRDTGEYKASIVAEKLRHSIEREGFATRAGTLAVTISLGIAARGEEADVASLARRADTALYTAKHNGRNRFELG